MTEQMKSEQAPEASLSTGQILSQARQAQGLSVEELAELIRVPQDVIEAIEKDKVPKNLPETFIRGYIRSYAKKVGVEEEQVLSSVVTTAAYEKVDKGPSQMQSFSRRTKRKAFERRLVLTTWVIGGALAVSLGIWWYQEKGADFAPLAGFSQSEQATEAVPKEEVPVNDIELNTVDGAVNSDTGNTIAEVEEQAAVSSEQNSDVESPVQALPLDNPAVETETAMDNDLADASQAQQAVEQVVTENADATAVNQAPVVLTQEQTALLADTGEVDEEGFIQVEMRFENDCWVEVYDVNEERIAIGNKPAGYLMTLNAQGPFNVLLGNPVGVSIWVNGKEFDTSSFPRNRVARFELDVVEDLEPVAVQ